VDWGIEQALLRETCGGSADPQTFSQEFAYYVVGRLTMLFDLRPTSSQMADKLSVTSENSKLSPIALGPEEYIGRPVFEVFNSFRASELIPYSTPSAQQAPSVQGLDPSMLPAPQSLAVSCLNASTLCEFGGLKIVWTYSLGSHLCFDSYKRKLHLFCLPSFCSTSGSEESILAK
jgi:hypothetical protein